VVGFPHKPAITRVDFSERGSAAWLADEVIENVDVGWRVGDIKGMAQRVGQTCKVKEHGDGAAGMFGEAERVANKRIGKATAVWRVRDDVLGAGRGFSKEVDRCSAKSAIDDIGTNNFVPSSKQHFCDRPITAGRFPYGTVECFDR